jgi:CshA-type fibril repeat protein
VTPVSPDAVDDSAVTPYGHVITIDVLANDRAGDKSAPLVTSSLVLKDPTGAYRKTITRPGEGTYSAASGGTVTFTPVKDFQGVTTPTTYRIADDNGTTAEALVVFTVGKGPSAVADTATTKQNVTVTVDALANDEPGTGAQLDHATFQLYERAWGQKVAIPGQGEFSIATGKITFDPALPRYCFDRLPNHRYQRQLRRLDRLGDGHADNTGECERPGDDSVRDSGHGRRTHQRQAGRHLGTVGRRAAGRSGDR